MMQINFKNFGMNMSFLFTMARELFAGLYYRAYFYFYGVQGNDRLNGI